MLFGASMFLGAFYFLQPQKFKEIGATISWYGVSTYHRTRIFLNDYTTPVEKIENVSEESGSENELEEKEDESSYLELVGLTNEGEIKSICYYPDDEINEDEWKVLFLKFEKNGKSYFKRITNESYDVLFDMEMNILPRQFLQVEIDNNGKMDIHEYISQYYVDGNVIFDKEFMKYYVMKWYNAELEEKYKINIIDKNITLLNLNEDNKGLHLTNGSYVTLN
jgi:hypothetical protein